MPDEIDLRFLGVQIKRLQGDVRNLKADMAEKSVNVDGISTATSEHSRQPWVEWKELEAFRESVDDRFDQQIELLKSSFRSLSEEIQTIKKS